MSISYPIQKLIGIKTTIHRVLVNGFSVEYVKAGHGPPLLLLHGANIGWIQWYNVIAPLARSYTVYAFDWPGSGNSTKIDFSRLDINRNFVRLLSGFIEAIQIHNVRIIAHSVSGVAAMYYAYRNPQIVKKLILIDSMGFTDYLPPSNYPVAIPFFAWVISKTAMKPTKKTMGAFLHSVLAKTVHLPDEFIDHFYYSVVREHQTHPLMFMQALTHGFHIRKELVVTNVLSEISSSILVLHGTKDPLIPVDTVASIISHFPRVTLKRMEGVGHVPSLEDPKQFLHLVTEFLL